MRSRAAAAPLVKTVARNRCFCKGPCRSLRATGHGSCFASRATVTANRKPLLQRCWAEAPVKIARMTLTAKLDGNWSSFQLANNTPPLSVTGSVIAPSARIFSKASAAQQARALDVARVFVAVAARFTKRARACALSPRAHLVASSLGTQGSPKNS